MLWGETGKTAGLWTLSLCSFTSVIFVVNIKIFLTSRSLTVGHFVSILITSVGLYVSWMWISNYLVPNLEDTIVMGH